MFNYQLPFVTGMDLSGVVEAVGSQVSGFAAGAEVYGLSNVVRQGAHAEYAALSAADVAAKPTTIDHIHAAAIPLAGLTAWQALESAELQPGQTVLIHGGGGGVGSFAVQFALHKGARVLATASTGKQELLRQLGVTEAIDYTTTRFEDVAHAVDTVLDTIGGETLDRSWAVLKPGGTLVTAAGQVDAAAMEAKGVRGIAQHTRANAAQLAEIARLIDAGKVQVIVSDVYPLAEAQQAHIQLEAGHARGKIVLRVAAEG
jgi:NADPH:quinone reductase-like Zn-dependent oxidoreductase